MMGTQLRVLLLGINGTQMACKFSYSDVLICQTGVTQTDRAGAAHSQLASTDADLFCFDDGLIRWRVSSCIASCKTLNSSKSVRAPFRHEGGKRLGEGCLYSRGSLTLLNTPWPVRGCDEV